MKAVAKSLQIGERTLWRMIAAGQFPPPDVSVGGKIRRWKRVTVVEWIETRKDPAERDRLVSAICDGRPDVSSDAVKQELEQLAADVAATDAEPQRRSQAQLLVELADEAELFHDADGVAYASVPVNDHQRDVSDQRQELQTLARPSALAALEEGGRGAGHAGRHPGPHGQGSVRG